MQLSSQEYYDKFSLCAMDKDVKSLLKIKADLIKQRKLLDRWFDKYLDMFETKMSHDNTDTPVWKLYKSKSNEYSELNRIIIAADTYIKKVSNV